MRVQSLSEVATAVEASLGSAFFFVNTRLVLRTGVNLREIDPALDGDDRVLAKVLATLAEFGIHVTKDGVRR